MPNWYYTTNTSGDYYTWDTICTSRYYISYEPSDEVIEQMYQDYKQQEEERRQHEEDIIDFPLFHWRETCKK